MTTMLKNATASAPAHSVLQSLWDIIIVMPDPPPPPPTPAPRPEKNIKHTHLTRPEPPSLTFTVGHQGQSL